MKGTAQMPFTKDPMAKAKAGNVPVEEFAEPIFVNVIPTLAKVNVGNLPGNTVKIGMMAELLVKVDRQNDYAGEFKVKLTLPVGTTGVSVQEATIPAGRTK
ncbi:MAG: hypothetical protein U0792_22420 [Gemmataceae bacterium]